MTTSFIANQLQVSGKTIERELHNIDRWLHKKGLQLEKKPRYGLKISASDLQRQELLKAINEENATMIFSQENRRILNILELLKQKEPVKLYSLSRHLNVTESTISSDLDKIEEYLSEYNLLLVRKPGFGVYLQGNETDIRRISIDLIHENIETRKLIMMEKGGEPDNLLLIEDYIRKKVLGLIDMDHLQKTIAIVKALEKDMKISFVEISYIDIIVHILLMLGRLKLKEPFQPNFKLEATLQKSKEWAMARFLQKKMKETLKIVIPEEELSYLAIHLRGAKRYNSRSFDENITSENLRIIKLAKDMIKLTESETGLFLDEDGEMFVVLVYHLMAVISRISMNLAIRNPFVEEIKEHYPKEFKIASQCAQLLEKRFSVIVPQTEIGYIAMHLGGAIVKFNNNNERVYQVVISCILGIGSSGLMKSRIEKDFPNIKVNAILPIEDIKNDYLKGSGIDFVISTVAVASPHKPIICVNQILLQEDRIRIKDFITRLPQKNMLMSNTEKIAYSSEKKLQDLKETIEAIGSIVDNFYIHCYQEVMPLEEIIAAISGILGPTKAAADSIKTALMEREKYGRTILSKDKAILLHCKTEGVTEVYFQIVRMKNPIQVPVQKNKNETIDLILLMVVPKKCNDNTLEIMQHISYMLIEKKDFIVNLRERNFNDLKSYLNKMLLHYYQGKI